MIGCDRALSGQDAKSGRFSYYVCRLLTKRGSGACDAPRLNARRFEEMVVGQIRANTLTESNVRRLVRLVGHPGIEPGTSVLSGLRSNRLSQWPVGLSIAGGRGGRSTAGGDGSAGARSGLLLGEHGDVAQDREAQRTDDEVPDVRLH